MNGEPRGISAPVGESGAAGFTVLKRLRFFVFLSCKTNILKEHKLSLLLASEFIISYQKVLSFAKEFVNLTLQLLFEPTP